jgi:ribosomal-protein-serine acetyltransferase
MSWIDSTRNVEDIRLHIGRALRRTMDGTEVHWGIWRHGCFAGIIGTHPIQRLDRWAEFGYWLGEEFQGNGLMTAAARAMTAHLFTEFDLHRLELHIRTNNPRSRAIAERLGFTLEGIQGQAAWSNGQFVDIACYGLLRETWDKMPESRNEYDLCTSNIRRY